MRPIQLNERITTLDVLRGFALFGIIFANVIALLEPNIPNTEGQHQYFYALQIFVEGKFFTIFSFLFGVGFYLFINRSMKKGENGYVLFAKRLLLLLVFGMIHMQFQSGEALNVYAVCGFLLLFAFRLPKGVNLGLGLILLALITVLGAKILMTLPLILLGMAAGQSHLFDNIRLHLKKWVMFTVVTGLLSGICIWVLYSDTQTLSELNTASEAQLQSYHFRLNLSTWFAPILSAFYVGLLVLLNESHVMQKLLKPLQAFGRMALTNYLLQTALILLVGSISQMTFSNLETGLISLVINVVLMVGSVIWLHRFSYGPMEKIWRIGTYATWTRFSTKKVRS